MKYLVLMVLFSATCFAQETPPYLRDAVITVVLKDGQTHVFSANEYAVIKRQEKKLPVEDSQVEPTPTIIAQPKVKAHKHIISGEVLSSRNGGIKDRVSGNSIEIETERKIGVGVMYQNNIHKNMYLGGRIDSNGGAGINLGLGF